MKVHMNTPTQTPISLEFFPPKTEAGAEKLKTVRQELYALQPEFCSVTYGAGGSTQAGTFSTVQEILNEGIPAASHFSCIGATYDTVRTQLQQLHDMGVRSLVALRGDLPSGHGVGGDFTYASDLVAFIRAETGDAFHIEVAGYPETHPQAASPKDDLLALKAKVDAGADGIITQYFFNSDAYFRYCDEAQALGIHTPIVPGIMPISNSSQLIRFSDACGAEIPRWLRLRLQDFGDDTESIKALGLDVITALCERLMHSGVPALHFYTMNQSATVQALCTRLGLG